MKVREITDAFSVRREGEESLILKVLDTIKDPKRRMKMKLSYREIKFIYDEFLKDQKNIVNKFIKEYCDEENIRNKNTKEYKELKIEEIQMVPPHKMAKYRIEIGDLIDTDVPIKTPLKFTQKEIEDSKILFSEEMLIDNFIVQPKIKVDKKTK